MDLSERKKELTAEFQKLGEQLQKLVDQGSELQRQANAIKEEQVRLQGAHREIERLIEAEAAETAKAEVVN